MREQPYEKPLAAGRLVFEREGQPVGRVESWRLSRALEGYSFLRADVDERESNGRSFLYNALVNPDGLVENLRYRFFAPGRRVQGQLLCENGFVTNTREVSGQRFEEEIELAENAEAHLVIWYPAVSGLTLLTRRPEMSTGLSVDAAAIDDPSAEKWFKMVFTRQQVEQNGQDWHLDIKMGDSTADRHWHLGWNPQTGVIHHASNGEVVRVERNIRYRGKEER